MESSGNVDAEYDPYMQHPRFTLESLFGKIVLLNLCVECFKTNAEDFCRDILVPVDAFEYSLNVHPFDLSHRNCTS